MTDVTLGSWVARRAERSPHRSAVIFEGVTRTYAEFDVRVRRLAQVLRKLGARSGDRVGYLGPSHPAFLELLFAAGSLGAVAVPINHRLDAGIIGHILQDSGCRVLIVAGDMPQGVAAAQRSMPQCVLIRLSEEGPAGYESLLDAASDDRIHVPVSLNSLALLVYTSGTTGLPKGVALTHGNLVWNVFNFLVGGDFRRDDVTLSVAPFFRVGGIAVTVLETLLMGGTVVIMPAFDAARALRLIEEHSVSVLFGGPDLLQALIADPSFREEAFASVRVCYTGGAPVPHHLLRTYLARNIPIIQGYGLSEAAPLALLLDPEDIGAKVGSAGRPAFFSDLRVARPDGEPVQIGEVGEVLVAGPNVMQGYWNSSATDEHLLHGRWLRTGDAARTDADGFVSIVGRMVDAYATFDTVVHPGDIETVLREHPAIADAAVVGVPDPDAGAVGRAFVELTPGRDARTDEILSWVAARTDPAVVPRDVVIVAALPRNPAGKILRAQLR